MRLTFLFTITTILASVPLSAGEAPALWQIGTEDRDTRGLALAPAGWQQFAEDPVFIVGTSEPAKDWPYAHPGPEDDWAGSRNHVFSIRFGLEAAPAVEASLVVALVDTHFTKPPRLAVRVNGRGLFDREFPKGAGNDSIEGKPAAGRPHRVAIPVPSGALRAGDNAVELETVSGSWFLYDAVALYAPAGARLVPVKEVPAIAAAPSREVTVEVGAAAVVRTMAGGIGGSWHAIEEPIPVVGGRSHGGSGWGANPPAADAKAWAQVFRHADWLGLDFCRVEVEQRIYQPERDRFTWDSPEMGILYRILDGCERRGVDVFFQQMWMNVDWNAFPEFRGDAVKRVHSGPLSMADFADGLAALVEHLVKTRRYTCLKWISITNEPGHDWSWWQEPPNRPMPLAPGLQAVREALDRKGIAVPLAGPDWTDLPPLDPKRVDFDDAIGAYDLHSYTARFDWEKGGGYPLSDAERRLAGWAAWARERNKPLFLTELGSMTYGWGGAHPGPASWDAAIKDAELVLRGIAAGVDGFNRWSVLNRGDLDGQWQMVDTWDPAGKKLLATFTPHPNAYFVYGLLSRFTAKRSAVLKCGVSGGRLGAHPRVFASALRSPKGQVSCFVLNDAPAAWTATLSVQGLGGRTLHKYQVTEAVKDRPDLRIEPSPAPAPTADGRLVDELPPRSLTVYTSYRLSHDDAGIAVEAGK